MGVKKAVYRAVRWLGQVRIKIIGPLGEKFPEDFQFFLDYYEKKTKAAGRSSLHFVVDGLPKSLNHMYGRKTVTDKVTGHQTVRTWRKKEVDDFNLRTYLALQSRRFGWKPTGPSAALILFESPRWLNGKLQIIQMDTDNRIKVVMDATEKVTDVPDELYWQVCAFKVASKRTRTWVYLFDLGDIVEYFY